MAPTQCIKNQTLVCHFLTLVIFTKSFEHKNKYLPKVSEEAVFDRLHKMTRLPDDAKNVSFEKDKAGTH